MKQPRYIPRIVKCCSDCPELREFSQREKESSGFFCALTKDNVSDLKDFHDTCPLPIYRNKDH